MRTATRVFAVMASCEAQGVPKIAKRIMKRL
jgi:hypothetical protein